jgi:TM2 domain-containing membrane protein YozV
MEERIIIQQKPPKSPVLAAILSVIFPGTGALYNGQIGKGILYIILFAGLITMQDHGGQPFVALLLAGFYIFQVIESINTAKAINQAALSGKPEAAPATLIPEIANPQGSIFWGAVLVVLGGVLLLANFDVLSYETIFDFWPLAVIGLGLKLVADYFLKSKSEN